MTVVRIVFLLLLITCQPVKAQFLMDMVDTTSEIGKGMLGIYKKFDHVIISGYMQPQFQVVQSKGAKSFAGGDFPEDVNNRFMLRRGRLKVDYIHLNKDSVPGLQFVFQFDGTERGVNIRDFWGRVFEHKYDLFSFTMGMFARPFSYELNVSSSDRETPERGRMSQILMKTERDMGAMVSFEPQKKNHRLKNIKLDVGLFNGQGLAAPGDFDSRKDLISRLSLKPVPLSKKFSISAGVSLLNGGLIQNTKYIYRFSGNEKKFVLDSSVSNKGRIAPRKYYGADVQLKQKTRAGFTELRLEYMLGTQTSTKDHSETPPVKLTDQDGYYIRKFDGAYLYLLHNIFNPKHQLIVKYDWYDPNTGLEKMAINGMNNSGIADIKYSTLGFGYVYYINTNLKAIFWYDKVKNESTALPEFERDIKDDVFTFRLQFRF